METYRSVWNNFFNYLKEHQKMKNCEKINSEHVEAYIFYKLEYYPSKQYLEKISCALGKLEIALNQYSRHKYLDNATIYNFKIRKKILKQAIDLKLIANNFKNRVYKNPSLIIEKLTLKHKIAASIQLYGGARVEGVTLIKKSQLKGYAHDPIRHCVTGVIETQEKGGKIGKVKVSVDCYKVLSGYFFKQKTDIFRIDYQKYNKELKDICMELNIEYKGTHGLRWTFAQNRVRAYQDNGNTYEYAIQAVSFEMKHYRASITEHYL